MATGRELPEDFKVGGSLSGSYLTSYPEARLVLEAEYGLTEDELRTLARCGDRAIVGVNNALATHSPGRPVGLIADLSSEAFWTPERERRVVEVLLKSVDAMEAGCQME